MDGNKLLHHQLSVAQQLLREERDKNAALLTEIHGPQGWKVTCSRYATLAASLHRAAHAYLVAQAAMVTPEDQAPGPKLEAVKSACGALVSVLNSVPPPPPVTPP